MDSGVKFKKRTIKAQPRVRQRSPEVESSSAATTSQGGEATEQEEEKLDLRELLELRKIQRSQARLGIDVTKLNQGDVKKRKAPTTDDPSAPASGSGSGSGDGVKEGLSGGDGGLKAAADDDDAGDDPEQQARKIVQKNNFTQQTNALAVDKHMMAYIEEGIKKRRGEQGIADPDDLDPKNSDQPYDPYEQLFKIDERYKIPKKEVSRDEEEEGNVTNSMAMLTAIPEVDLGMDTRLKNIEATEKAKRQVAEARRARYQQHQAAGGNANDPDLGATRFFRPHQNQTSDAEILRVAKLEAQGLPAQPERKGRNHERRDVATDEQVMERFKKRMRK